MTTTLDIIARALRVCRVLGAGRTPKAQDAADGLTAMQGLVDHLAGYGASHPYDDVYKSGNVELSRDHMCVRLHANTQGSAWTVTLPENPRDGARFMVLDAGGSFSTQNLTVNSNGFLFDATANPSGVLSGGSRTTTILSTANLSRAWMYRADLGAWLPISGLALADAFPFPAEFDQSFGYMLAVLISTEYGVELAPAQKQHAQWGYSRLAARYVPALPVRVDSALLGWGGAGRARWF